jgi:DNA-binding beta-propeller fold protein YncE
LCNDPGDRTRFLHLASGRPHRVIVRLAQWFFTAGLASNTDGLFGAISVQSVPEPSTAPLIVGPGGLAYDSKNDTLFVAATGNNEIFAIKHASKTRSDHGTGALVYQDQAHLRGPIGVALAPNGDLLTTN